MFKKINSTLKTHDVILLSFFIPILIMAALYLIQGVYPFGNSSLLTIDLGQQYIDFYADFRSNFLTNPSQFFYSFQKSLGGEMIGLSAYYLTSPFNLFFLLFPRHLLSVAVTLLTLIKLGAMGLSFSLYLKNVFPGDKKTMVLFSVFYALMGYTIVYQLNLMWLDGVIFLPLIAIGLERLIESKKGIFYTLFLALTLFSTYYVGYMISLFLPFYFGARLIATRTQRTWGATLQQIGLFLFYSVLGAGLVSGLLLPVLSTLLTSKGGYMNTDFSFQLAYPIQELLSKFVIGAFNFDQMPSGLPTVFVGSVASISFLFYLIDKRFDFIERLYVGGLAIFLLLSMNVEALNKVWHAMQFPVWFPYRFAFLFSFLILVNGYRSFAAGIQLQLRHLVLALIGVAGSALYLGLNIKHFDYLSLLQVLLSSLFMAVFLVLFFLPKKQTTWVYPLLCILALGEVAGNAGITLSNLGYIAHDKYTYEVKALSLFSEALAEHDQTFFRTEKTFLRSKNDSHQAQYKGITHFSSTFEHEMPELFKHLGFSAHNGFMVYANSTLVTDALFGVSYYLNDRSNAPFGLGGNPPLPPVTNPYSAPDSFEWDVVQTKPDLYYYPLIQTIGDVEMRKNPYALPVGFGSAASIKNVDTHTTTPLDLQSDLLNALQGTPFSANYFSEVDETSLDLTNTSIKGSTLRRKIQRNGPEGDASFRFVFPTNGKDSYYLTFHPSIKEKTISPFLNEAPFHFYHTYYEPLVFNVGNPVSPSPSSFRIEMKKNEVETTNMAIYRLDTDRFKDTIRILQKGGLRVESFTNTSLAGYVHIQPSQSVLLLTIPYSKGWKATVDGKPVRPYKVVDGLMAIDISPGEHMVSFSFFPPLLLEGMGVSLLSWIVLLVLHKTQAKRDNPSIKTMTKTSKK